MSIAERDRKVIWHPYTQMLNAPAPIAIVKGRDALLYDEKGNTYTDAISSWWVNTHGHAHPYIAARVAEQASALEHVIFAGFTHAPAVELAERLLAKLPARQEKLFYSDNGSTAVEVALKMAFQYWHNAGTPRTCVIAFREAYHGDTFGAMSVSGRSAFTEPFSSLLFDVEYIVPPLPGQEEQSVRELNDCLSRRKDIAAFIFEPLVMGAGGMLMYSPEALDTLLRMCRDSGVLRIADEVMTGFGRTGSFFASDYLHEKPEIFCLSKGITGGTLALGATTCKASVYDAFLSGDRMKTLFHGHSFTANPIACAAALASLDLFESPSTWQSILSIGEAHTAFAEEIRSHPMAGNVRTTGTILALELRTAETTSYFNSLRDYAYNFFLSRGILLRPLGNVIYILPPYCITSEQLEQVYAAIRELLEDLKNKAV